MRSENAYTGLNPAAFKAASSVPIKNGAPPIMT
nr:MAG TPA: hypothetical protein [Caudoviricetes sp.]